MASRRRAYRASSSSETSGRDSTTSGRDSATSGRDSATSEKGKWWWKTLERLPDDERGNPWDEEGCSALHATTNDYLNLYKLGKNIRSSSNQEFFDKDSKTRYHGKINGAVVVSHLLLDGPIGKIARKLYDDYPSEQPTCLKKKVQKPKFPPGIKKLRVARNVVGDDGSVELGQLRRYVAQKQLTYWVKPEGNEQANEEANLWFQGGTYTNPWVAAALTAYGTRYADEPERYKNCKKRRAKRPKGHQPVTLCAGELAARKALLYPLTQAKPALVTIPDDIEVEKLRDNSSKPWQDLVLREFEAFLKNPDELLIRTYDKETRERAKRDLARLELPFEPSMPEGEGAKRPKSTSKPTASNAGKAGKAKKKQQKEGSHEEVDDAFDNLGPLVPIDPKELAVHQLGDEEAASMLMALNPEEALQEEAMSEAELMEWMESLK